MRRTAPPDRDLCTRPSGFGSAGFPVSLPGHPARGTGTLSGPDPGQGGSLLELSQGGKEPITLSDGERRVFLEDGDCVTLRGRCERPGFRAIGFGDCSGTVTPPYR